MTYQHNERENVTADYLKRMAQLNDIQAIKNYTHQCMAIELGHNVLDVGCGPGVDTIPLATWVGSTGKVVGVDADENMLAQATQWAEQEKLSHIIHHQKADATALPFEAGTFNSSHAERLLQVLPHSIDPQQVVNELKRVTRVGGRVVIADTDWGSFSIHSQYTTLEQQLTTFFASQLRPNGFAGRQLLGLFHSAQFNDIHVKIFPIVHTNMNALPLAWLYKEATQQHIAPQDQLDNWWQEINTLSEKNYLYATVNMVVVSGEV